MRMFVYGVVAALIVAAAAVYALELRPNDPAKPREVDCSKPIARVGEWVTNPDGSRVCRLRSEIRCYMAMSASLCEEWQGPIPGRGEQVPFLRWGPAIGSQINVEGEWRP